MQTPNCGNWDHENHEIAHDVDDASADEYDILIDALLSPRDSVGFADAFGDYGKDEGKSIEKVPVEDKPDAGARCLISLSFRSDTGGSV